VLLLALYSGAFEGSGDGARVVSLERGRGSLVLGGPEGARLVLGSLPPPRGAPFRVWVVDEGRRRPAGTFAAAGRETAVVRLRGPVPEGAVVELTLRGALVARARVPR
jgi:hypothetical protein